MNNYKCECYPFCTPSSILFFVVSQKKLEMTGRTYLHPAQDDDVQPLQPEPPPEESLEDAFDDLPMPKRDISLLVFFEPHFTHATSAVVPKTSFSKSALQALQ